MIKYTNINEEELQEYDNIPVVYNRPDGSITHGYNKMTNIHNEDGWRTFEKPIINKYNECYGEIIYDGLNDSVSIQVLDLPQDVIIQNYINKINKEKQKKYDNIIQILVDNYIDENIGDINELSSEECYSNLCLFPIWEENEPVNEGERRLWLDENNELCIWEVNENHITEIGLEPNITPSKWAKV